MVVICTSLFVVSRGINQLYGISKNLFPSDHQRNFIVEQVIMLLKTIAVFVLLLLIISLLTFIPVINAFIDLSKFVIFEDLYLFFMFFIILFLLYEIIPDVHVHILDVIIGAACASLLLLILLSGLEFYFSIADYTNVYMAIDKCVWATSFNRCYYDFFYINCRNDIYWNVCNV